MPDPILVTGASSGIGAATALWAAERGHDLLLAGRDRGRLEALQERVEDAGGVALTVAADLTEAGGVEQVLAGVERIEQGQGPLFGLVNNAGEVRMQGAFEVGLEESDRLHRETLELLFHAPRRLTEALVPAMLERGRGVVVNLASSASFRAFRGVAAYTAAKHALLGWTRVAAQELEGSGVHLAVVCPYYVSTPMLTRAAADLAARGSMSADEARATLERRNPAGEFVHPEQVAAVVLDLLAAPRNGRVVVLDGGRPRDLPEQK